MKSVPFKRVRQSMFGYETQDPRQSRLRPVYNQAGNVTDVVQLTCKEVLETLIRTFPAGFTIGEITHSMSGAWRKDLCNK